MKQCLLLIVLFLTTIFSTVNCADDRPRILSFHTIKSFFDSISIDEIEKERQLQAQQAQEYLAQQDDIEQTDDTVTNNVNEPKETTITRFFKSWVFTGTLGPAWENAGQTQTFYLAPRVKKTYAADNKTNTITQASLFFGVQKHLFSKISAQIGVTVATASDATLTGEIWDDANPKFNNLSYKYTVQATRIAAKGTLLFDNNLIVIPWINGSIGTSYNNFHNFTNAPLIYQVVVNPNFEPYTSQSFTYGFGAGCQRKLSDNWQIGAGYEFTDWGHGRFLKSSNQTTYNTISISHYYTNGLIFNLSYLA